MSLSLIDSAFCHAPRASSNTGSTLSGISATHTMEETWWTCRDEISIMLDIVACELWGRKAKAQQTNQLHSATPRAARASLGGIRTHDTLQSRRALYQGNSAGRGSNLQHNTTQGTPQTTVLWHSIHNQVLGINCTYNRVIKLCVVFWYVLQVVQWYPQNLRTIENVLMCMHVWYESNLCKQKPIHMYIHTYIIKGAFSTNTLTIIHSVIRKDRTTSKQEWLLNSKLLIIPHNLYMLSCHK